MTILYGPCEQWKAIDQENSESVVYEVSDWGRFRSNSKGGRPSKETRIIKQPETHAGYFRVRIGNKKRSYTHRLVALAFIEKSDESREFVNHIDSNRKNNHVSNLEWVTAKENQQHSHNTTLRRGPNQKLSVDQVKEIYLSEQPVKHLSEKYGVHIAVIYAIKGKTTHSKWTKDLPNVNHAIVKNLTKDVVLAVISDSHLKAKECAEKHGIDRQQVYGIRRGICYSEITGILPKT